MLPFYVYANPSKFLANPSPQAIGPEDRRNLLESLYRRSQAPGQDVANDHLDPRARAMLADHPPSGKAKEPGSADVLDSVLTARAFGRASAYASRKIAESEYLAKTFTEYQPDPDLKNYRLLHDLCNAGILETGLSNVGAAETTIDFTHGWQIDPVEFRSDQEKSVLCFMVGPAELQQQLSKIGRPVPDIKVLLTVDAGQLARTEAAEGGSHRRDRQTRCISSAMTVPLPTDLSTISNALMGKEEHGCEIAEFLEDAPDGGVQLTRFYSTVAGLEVGGIGECCFADTGNNYCKELVRAVYDAAKARRAHGWTGKMLVRFDLTEGLARKGDSKVKGGGDRLRLLLVAMRAIEQELVDLHQYVILRAGGVARVNDDDARTMADLGMEADVHLDPVTDEGGSCGAGDIPKLAPSGDSALKLLLLNRVRVLLSTNGAGVERCNAAGEYRLAESMISSWNRKDSRFRHHSVSIDDIHENVRNHLEAMKGDTGSHE
jgi:hypothetical protein